MAEFCLDCLNKIMGRNDSPRKYIMSEEPEICEECGELKPVVIREKWIYTASGGFFERIGFFTKENGK